MRPSCLICQSITNNNDILLESDHWIITLAPHQTFLGKSYVSPRQHKASLSDLSAAEWSDLQGVIKTFESGAKNAFNATMFNWTCLLNDAYWQTDKPDPHVHWHVRPRYDHVVEINDQRFADDQFGRHYRTRWDGFKEQSVDDDTRQAIKSQLTTHFQAK